MTTCISTAAASATSAIQALNTCANDHAMQVATMTGMVATHNVLGRTATRHAASEPGTMPAGEGGGDGEEPVMTTGDGRGGGGKRRVAVYPQLSVAARMSGARGRATVARIALLRPCLAGACRADALVV